MTLIVLKCLLKNCFEKFPMIGNSSKGFKNPPKRACYAHKKAQKPLRRLLILKRFVSSVNKLLKALENSSKSEVNIIMRG